MKYLVIILTLGLIACQSNTETTTNQETTTSFEFPDFEQPKDTLNVAFLIMNGVYNTELTAPMDIFQHTIFHTENGMKVFTIARNTEPIVSFEGLKIVPDYSYQTMENVPPIDVLVVPSAEHHLDSDLQDTEMIEWVAKVGNNAKLVTSHCDGAFVLAKAGLLNDVVSTTFPSDIDLYKKTFPSLEVADNVLFVHDGKYVTSAGGAKSFEAALYVVELLYGKKVADGVAKGLVIDWDVNAVPSVVR